MADRIQLRRDTEARWTEYDPILLEGEVGFVTDNPNKYKIGDGVRTWSKLPFRGFDGTIVHTLGTSTTSVMSQNATTKAIKSVNSDVNHTSIANSKCDIGFPYIAMDEYMNGHTPQNFYFGNYYKNVKKVYALIVNVSENVDISVAKLNLKTKKLTSVQSFSSIKNKTINSLIFDNPVTLADNEIIVLKGLIQYTNITNCSDIIISKSKITGCYRFDEGNSDILFLGNFELKMALISDYYLKDAVTDAVQNIKTIDNTFNDVIRWIFEQTYMGATDEIPFKASVYSSIIDKNGTFYNYAAIGFKKIYGVYIISSAKEEAKIFKYSSYTQEKVEVVSLTPTKINKFEYIEFQKPIILDSDYEIIGVSYPMKYIPNIGKSFMVTASNVRSIINATMSYIPVGDHSVKNNIKNLETISSNSDAEETAALQGKEIVGLRSYLPLLSNSLRKDIYDIWFNDFKPKDGKVSGIIFKNKRGGKSYFFKVKCSHLWATEEEYKAGPALLPLIEINTNNYSEGELVYIPINVELKEDEYIGMSGRLYFGQTINCGYKQRSIKEAKVDKDFCIAYWLVADSVLKMNNYIEIFNDKFIEKDAFNWTFSGDWSVTENGLATTSINSYIRSKRIYHYDKRRMRLKFSCNTSTVLKVFCSYGDSISSGTGATGFIVDFINRKLTLCKTGDGTDSQLWGATIHFDNELSSIKFPAKLGIDDGVYILEVEKDELKISCVLLDCKTGQKAYIAHEGWGAGRLNQFFGAQLVDGVITLKEFNVTALYNPDIIVVGDSITEGQGTTDKTKRYCSRLRVDCPDKNIVLSARGGDTIYGVISKFFTEYLLVRPKIISVLIGANANNTADLLNQIIWLSKLIGARVVFHYNSAMSNVNRMQSNNELIEALDENYRGARFDMSLLTDNDPWITEVHTSLNFDKALYADDAYLHPNNNGQGEMYNRLKIDTPFFYD